MTGLNPTVGARPYPCSMESSTTHVLDPTETIVSTRNINTEHDSAKISTSSSLLAVAMDEVLLPQASSLGGNTILSALRDGGNYIPPLNAFSKPDKSVRAIEQCRDLSISRSIDDTGSSLSTSVSGCQPASGYQLASGQSSISTATPPRVSAPSSITLISTSADPKAKHDSGIKAAIVVSVLVLVAILALGVIYFNRRKGRLNRTRCGHLEGVNVDPESAIDEHLAGRTDFSAMMSRDKEVSADAVIRTGDSSPGPFSFALGILAKDSTHPPPHRVSLDCASSRTSDDLGHRDPDMSNGRSASSPTLSSYSPASPDAPFFHQLKAMRRRGELRKPPTPVTLRHMESSDDEEDSAHWMGIDPNVHECSKIPESDVHTS